MSEHDFSHSDGKLLDTETDGSTVRPAARGVRASRRAPGSESRVQGGPPGRGLAAAPGCRTPGARRRRPAAHMQGGTFRLAAPAHGRVAVPAAAALRACSAYVAALQIPRARRGGQCTDAADSNRRAFAFHTRGDQTGRRDAAAAVPDLAVSRCIAFLPTVVSPLTAVCCAVCACDTRSLPCGSLAGSAPPHHHSSVCLCGPPPSRLLHVCHTRTLLSRLFRACSVRAVRGCPAPVGDGRVGLRWSRR